MVSLTSFEIPNYFVWVISGVVFVFGVIGALYVAPWTSWCSHNIMRVKRMFRKRNTVDGNIVRRRGDFHGLCVSRMTTQVSLCFLAASQILWLPLLFGPYSVVAPGYVTAWTSKGWMCRIYILVSLGVFLPFFCSCILFILRIAYKRLEKSQIVSPQGTPSSGGKKVTSSTEQSPVSMLENVESGETTPQLVAQPGSVAWKPDSVAWSPDVLVRKVMERSSVLVPAVLFTFPACALQSVTAFISLAFSRDGGPIEASPESVVGYFVGVFWFGTPEECSNDPAQQNIPECTMCCFPACSVIIHGCWSLAYVLYLWHTAFKLKKVIVNRSMQRKISLFCMCFTVLLALSVGTMGASIAYSPFGWINQGLWLGFFACIMAMGVLACFLWILKPVHAMRQALRAEALDVTLSTTAHTRRETASSDIDVSYSNEITHPDAQVMTAQDVLIPVQAASVPVTSPPEPNDVTRNLLPEFQEEAHSDDGKESYESSRPSSRQTTASNVVHERAGSDFIHPFVSRHHSRNVSGSSAASWSQAARIKSTPPPSQLRRVHWTTPSPSPAPGGSSVPASSTEGGGLFSEFWKGVPTPPGGTT